MHFHLFAIFERIYLIFAIPVLLTRALNSCSASVTVTVTVRSFHVPLMCYFFFPLTSQCWRWVALDLIWNHLNGLASVTVLTLF